MKLISKILLSEYGFTETVNKEKTKGIAMTKNNFTVILKEDGECYFISMGIAYPLRDLGALKKLYKEVRSEEMKEN
ncbi:MAG TPA: hypothetical protein VK835_02640 [Bacteroidia bacterium]|jgi:hypothetical protein|nr:hypothetical protein [Bacteroidia bacterium]